MLTKHVLPKYWRLRMLWDTDQTLTYNAGARIEIRLCPWKIVSGNLSYGTTITENLGFVVDGSILDEEEVEGTVVDNTSNLYQGIKGFFKVIADANGTDGTAWLFLEESDDNSNWPSDQADFDVDLDLKFLTLLKFSTTAVDQGKGTNFEF